MYQTPKGRLIVRVSLKEKRDGKEENKQEGKVDTDASDGNLSQVIIARSTGIR
jgi:hypothetical protein